MSFFDGFRQAIVQVFGGITKGRKDDNLLVSLVDGVGKLMS